MELLFNFNPFNAGFIRLPPVNITYLHSGNEIDINCPLPYVRMSTSELVVAIFGDYYWLSYFKCGHKYSWKHAWMYKGEVYPSQMLFTTNV
jgi:hypothetical protein